jgi:inner membrane protein
MSSPNQSSSPNQLPSSLERFTSSQFARLFVIGFLVLILQIPTLNLFSIINERQNLRQTAIQDITSKWGKEQVLVGPRLMVPYIKRIAASKDKPKADIQKIATFLPDTLNITGQLATETRYRGLFQVPVYSSQLELTGKFDALDFSSWGIPPEDILWDRSELAVQISDTRAISTEVNLKWNDVTLPFNPGLGKLQTGEARLNLDRPDAATRDRDGTYTPSVNIASDAGIHTRLIKQIAPKTAYQFSIPLALRGSERLTFVPMGKLTTVNLASNWPSPSFQGGWLPEKSTVTAKGFEAKWQIPFLGRNYPQQWTNENPIADSTIYQSRFGVDLFSPVDNYHMAQRSIKYNFLFIILTFAVFWLFELTVRLRIHPLQYLLVGVAMCLFYLLQLAISEHLGFDRAYLISTIAVAGLITTYTMSILRARRRAAIVGVMQVSLYGYLYVVLASQDYSLLLGSIGLFGFLAIVMFVTRRIDWFGASPVQKEITPSE